jgi:hypothetical protein
VAAAIYTAARILKIYACTIPVRRPSAVIIIGITKGVSVSNIATIIPPLIILPNFSLIPKNGTETNTLSARAVVVESELVGET